MSITTPKFLIFAAVGIVLYYIFPKKYRWVETLIWSVLFYILSGVQYLPFMAMTVITIWYASYRVNKIYEAEDADIKAGSYTPKEKKAVKDKYKKKARNWVTVAILINIGFLVYGKVMNYIGVNLHHDSLVDKYIIPIGISYYTFSTVGYLLDVYWKKYKYEDSFLHFATYAFYYPHILQGPISRYDQSGYELRKEHEFSTRNLTMGCERMLWGFFKKLVIADRIAQMTLFHNKDLPGALYFIGVFFDVIQIYSDFSGYMDIVCGISEIMGIKLEENFNHPFFAKSTPELWRRWHMTLGGWFRDYLYYPLLVTKTFKNLNKKTHKHLPALLATLISTGIPVMITWILTGLWHGTGAGYLAWGLYYGTLITISVVFHEQFLKLNKLLHINDQTWTWKVFQMVRTFCVFAGGRMLTKGGRFLSALHMIGSMFSPSRIGIHAFFDKSFYNYGMDEWNTRVVLFGAFIMLIVSILQEKFVIREKLNRQNLVFRWAFLLLGFFLVLIYGIYGTSYSTAGFLYQAF